jgi:LPXTG-motif cell wall-anchored protein
VLALAASGAMAVTIPAYSAFAADGAGADSEAAGSPGLIAGNTVQLPVDVPVNVCGNTVNVVGLLNPAAGNTCANDSGGGHRKGSAGSAAKSGGKDSPGVVSGNGVQVPVDLPVNVSGNTVDVVGIGNPATGNESGNGTDDRPQPPRGPAKPAAPKPTAPEPAAPKPVAPVEKTAPPRHVPPREAASALARTGADQTLPALAGGAALVLGGAVLYRRFRPRLDG